VIVTRADDGNIFVTWALHIITGSNPQVWTQNKLGRHDKLSCLIFEVLRGVSSLWSSGMWCHIS